MADSKAELTFPEPPKRFDDVSFYERSLLNSWSFRAAMALVTLSEFALFTFASRYWRGLAASDRGMVLILASLLPFCLFREIFEHERFRNRLAGLDAEGKVRELTKRAARLTYDRLILPSLMLALTMDVIAAVTRTSNAGVTNACQGVLR